MPARRIHPHGTVAADALADGLAALAAELELPEGFPPAVEAEIEGATPAGAEAMRGQLVGADEREDATALPLVTLDPFGSKDLDQAFAIEPGADGSTLLHYAIADVGAHVIASGAVEAESLVRGETVYLPGHRIPLHPPQLSEGLASLLPEQERLAVLWTLTIDGSGALVADATHVRRARVRSTAQLDYASAQADLDAGRPHPQIAALAELGPRLVAEATRRGAIELPEPEQDLIGDTDAGWTLAWLPRTQLDGWNAQLSLATGRAAAALMLRAGRGLLRTLPPAPPEATAGMRDAARALGLAWPESQSLAELLDGLTGTTATELAFLEQCRILLRGAGYLLLDPATPPTADAAFHAAVAAPYAHVTAPLRRLGDRYATESALAAAHGVPVPDWAARQLPQLPALLTAAARKGGAANRGIVDLAEAVVLSGRVGELFDVAVVEVGEKDAAIQVEEPPVRARCDGPGLIAGTRATAELTVADVTKRRVRFALAPPPESGI
ncbi:MAG: RNB domain-containing ribonuclease [Solirubrobacteraceae bacterium]|nr:RNB domain-containing ribonuclease [Solirubrobacteraceae bacterium]